MIVTHKYPPHLASSPYRLVSPPFNVPKTRLNKLCAGEFAAVCNFGVASDVSKGLEVDGDGAEFVQSDDA
jgi:hypothetical protein